MSRKIMKNVATFTLFCFLLTPLYGLFKVEAAENSDDVSVQDVQSTKAVDNITFSVGTTMNLYVNSDVGREQEVTAQPSKMRKSARSISYSSVRMFVHIDSQSNPEVDGWILQFVNDFTGDKYTLDSSITKTITLPYGTYTIYPVKLPPSITYNRLDAYSAHFTVDRESMEAHLEFSSVDIASGNSESDLYIICKTIGESGKIDEIVSNVQYTVNLLDESGGDERFLSSVVTDEDGVGYLRIKPSMYNISIDNYPLNLALDNAYPPMILQREQYTVVTFYLMPNGGYPAYNTNITINGALKDDGTTTNSGEGTRVIFRPQSRTGYFYTQFTDGWSKITPKLPRDNYDVIVDLPYDVYYDSDNKRNYTTVIGIDDDITRGVFRIPGDIQHIVGKSIPVNSSLTIKTECNGAPVNVDFIIEKLEDGTFVDKETSVDGTYTYDYFDYGTYSVRLFSKDYIMNPKIVTLNHIGNDTVTLNVTEIESLPVRNAIVRVQDDYDETPVSISTIELVCSDGTKVTLPSVNVVPEYPVWGYGLDVNKTYTVQLKSVDPNYILNSEVFNIPTGRACAEIIIPVTYTKSRNYPLNVEAVKDSNKMIAVPNATVKFTKNGDSSFTPVEITSDSEGKFKGSLPKGNYTLELISVTGMDEANSVPQTISHGYQASLSQFKIKDKFEYEIKIVVKAPTSADNPELKTLSTSEYTTSLTYKDGLATGMAGVISDSTNGSRFVITKGYPWVLNIQPKSELYKEYTYTLQDSDFLMQDGKPVMNTMTVTLELNLDIPVDITLKDPDGNPEPGVKIKFVDKNTGDEYEITSGPDGDLDIDIPEGNYDIVPVIDGKPTAYTEPSTYTHTNPAPHVDIVVHEEKLYTIEFELRYPDGTPATGETINLTGTKNENLTANDEGKIVFKVPEGVYGFFYKDELDMYEDITNNTPIVVDRSVKLAPIKLSFKRGLSYVVNFQAVNKQDGTGVNGMKFDILDDTGAKVNNITTSDNGNSSLMLAPGDYVLKNTEAPSGYGMVPNKNFTVENSNAAVIVEVERTGTTDTSIIMQVVNKDNRPTAGVKLGFYKGVLKEPVPSVADYEVTSTVGGAISLTLEPGTYGVTVNGAPASFEHDGKVLRTFSVSEGQNKDVGILKEMTVSGNESPSLDPINPNPGGEDDPNPPVDEDNEGTLVIKTLYNGSSISDVRYSVTDEEGNSTSHTSTSSDTILARTVGTYVINILSVPEGYALSNASCLVVDVEKNRTTTVTINVNNVMIGGNDNTLIVNAMFNGKGVNNVGFSLHDSDGNFVAQGMTDGSGSLRFNNLKRGAYTLHNTSVGDGYALVSSRNIDVGGTTTVNIPLELQQGSIIPGGDIVFDKNFGAASVILKDKIGNPIADAEFTLYDFDDNSLKEVTSDLGIANFTEVNAGVYYLVQTSVGQHKSRSLKRTPVTITKGETSTITLVAPDDRGHKIAGQVFDDINANGVYESKVDELYKGAKVQLLDDNGDVLLESKTNSDGEYYFDYIPNGDYTLKLNKVKGYNYIDKKYGTNKDSSLIGKRGEIDISVDDEDEEDILMGIVSEEYTVEPILGTNSGKDNNTDKTSGRFPTLGDNNNSGLFNSENKSNNGLYEVDYESDRIGLYKPTVSDVDIDVSGTVFGGQDKISSEISSPNQVIGEDKTSNLPKTGGTQYWFIAVIYILFMFVVLYTFRRYVFDKLIK